MESKGRLTDVSRNWKSGKIQLTFEIDANIQDTIPTLERKELRIRAVEWREKRSLNANAYFYVLLSKLAEAMGVSNAYVHNEAIADYGYPEIINGKVMHIIMDDDVPWRELDNIHLKPTTKTSVLDNGRLYRVYIVMRGTHTYNSKEMAHIIDCLVQACKELNIETLPPEELARMYKMMEENDAKKKRSC